MRQRNGISKGQQALVGFLVIVLVLGSYILGIVALGSPASSCPKSAALASPCWTFVETGTFQPVLPAGGNFVSGTVTFPTPFPVAPSNIQPITQFDPSQGQVYTFSDTVTMVDPGNSIFRFVNDNTQVNATVPNADTAQKSFSNPVNGYTVLELRSIGYVQCTTTSTVQNINIKIKSGVTQKGNTQIVKCPQLAVDIPWSIDVSFVQTAAATLTLTVGAAAADANTAFVVNSFTVDGLGKEEIWNLMPAATTEIFGSTRNEMSFDGSSVHFGNVYSMDFSVDVVTVGAATPAKLEVQMSPDLATWTDPCTQAGLADLAINAGGVQLSSCLVTANTTPQYLRIVGFGGDGVKSPAFGLVTVTFNASMQQVSEVVFNTVTATGFTWFLEVNVPSINAKTYTIAWWAGLKG